MRAPRSKRSSNPRRTINLAASVLALACSLGVASAVLAKPEAPRPVPASPAASGHAAVDREADLEQEWRDYAMDLRDRVAFARARFEAAEIAYINGRNHHRLRGDVRRAAVDEREDARRALAAAEAALAALPDRARRAGVPPGWIRDPD